MSIKVAGIVAEYNPFHNGHKYMIEQIRPKGVTHVVAVMSGSVVQRGDVAVFDKHFRAKTAVQNGVDLVLELPFPFSCTSSETFSHAALSVLAGLGDNVVNTIAFGCENDDISLLKKTADVTLKLKDSNLVKYKLASGLSYPEALYQSARELAGSDVADVLKSPNNILAIEYIKSAKKLLPSVDFMPVKREFAEHDSKKTESNIASASHIRSLIDSNSGGNVFCPYPFENVPTFFLKRAEREMLFRLGSCEKSDLLEIADCSDDIADKIIKAMSECPKSLEEFYSLCKSRNVIMARLRRITMHLVLCAKKSNISTPPYARVLAFNKNGADILARCDGKLPVNTSLKALEYSSDYAKRIVKLENNAVLFQNMCAKGEYDPINEFKRFISIT